MSFLKHLFREKPPESFRQTIDIVPNVLRVHVYYHQVETLLESFPCWTFVSEGFSTVRQQEIAISLRTNIGESDSKIVEPTINYYKIVARLVIDGKFVGVGGVTEFGEKKFLERHLIYVEARTVPGVPISKNSLSALMIDDEELKWYKEFGILRLTARLGAQARYFPYPFWSDRDRKSVALETEREKSVLRQFTCIRHLSAYTFKDQSGFVLKLLKSEASAIRSAFEEKPSEAPWAFLGRLDSTADGCLAWDSASDEPFAISRPEAKGAKIAACFLAVAPTEEEKDAVCIVEDGFMVGLTAENVAKFKIALDSAGAFQIPGKFRLEWQ